MRKQQQQQKQKQQHNKPRRTPDNIHPHPQKYDYR